MLKKSINPFGNRRNISPPPATGGGEIYDRFMLAELQEASDELGDFLSWARSQLEDPQPWNGGDWRNPGTTIPAEISAYHSSQLQKLLAGMDLAGLAEQLDILERSLAVAKSSRRSDAITRMELELAKQILAPYLAERALAREWLGALDSECLHMLPGYNGARADRAGEFSSHGRREYFKARN